MSQRRMKEPAVPAGSPFESVVTAGRAMVLGLTRTLPSDPEDRNLTLAKVEGMEAILLLCQRAAAGEKLDAPRLVKVERSSLEDDHGVLRRIADLERHVAELEVYARGGARPALRVLPEMLETPRAKGGPKPSGLGSCAMRCLGVLKQRRGRLTSQVQIAIFSGYSITSGGLGQALADLRASGFVTGSRSHLQITSEGLAVAPDVEELPRGRALVTYWLSKLKGAKRTIFEAVYAAGHGGFSDVEDLAASTGYSPTSGGVGQALADLRKMELIGEGWPLRASVVFFEGGEQ